MSKAKESNNLVEGASTPHDVYLKLLSIFFVDKTGHEAIGITHHFRLTYTAPGKALFKSQIST